MLINFKTKNFRTFFNEAEINMIKDSKRDHIDTIIEAPKMGARILPISVIFGANDSGKTNMILAMQVLREIILRRGINNIDNQSMFLSNIRLYSLLSNLTCLPIISMGDK